MFCFGRISFDSILWFCASGNAFFAGTILLIITAITHIKVRNKASLYGVYLSYTIASLAIFLSSTPLPVVFSLFWLITFVGWQIARTKQKYASPVLYILISTSIIAILIEAPWHFATAISTDNISRIYVVGDSISAGMGTKNEKTWPILLSEELTIPATNLSIAGATVNTALRRQVPKVVGQKNLVFLEIGGNDLLSYNSPEKYETDLTEIIQHLKASSNMVVWFELPLLPQYYPYGRIQRKLAGRMKVDLIPKSVLAKIFGTQGTTSDGIHLTSKGHEIMAQEIRRIIK